LKGQQSQLRLFADNIPGPIAYLDRALRYTFVNQAFANVAARPQEEIYGRTPAEILPSDVAAFLRPVLEARAGRRERRVRAHRHDPGGDKRWMHGRIAPDFDGAGKVRGLYCTEYDIHDSSSPSRRSRRASSSCACSPTTSPSRSSTSTPSAATCSSTRRSCASTG
jgi:PAS domain S-box-containing protein